MQQQVVEMYIALLTKILEKIGNEDLSRGTYWGLQMQPIHFAASRRHLEVCRYVKLNLMISDVGRWVAGSERI